MLTSNLPQPIFSLNPSQEFFTLRSLKLISKMAIASSDVLFSRKLRLAKFLKSCSLHLNESETASMSHILTRSHRLTLKSLQAKKRLLPSKTYSKFPNLSSFDLSLSETQDMNSFSYLRKIKFLKLRSAQTPSFPSYFKFSNIKHRFHKELSKLHLLQKISLCGELDSKLLQFLDVLDNSLNSFPLLKEILIEDLKDKGLVSQFPNYKFYGITKQLSLKTSFQCQYFHHISQYVTDFGSLQTLSVEFQSIKNVDCDSLKSLQYLSSLKQLTFSIAGASYAPKNFLLKFFDAFTLPSNLEDLELSLEFVDWNYFVAKDESWSTNHFEEHAVFQNFFNQFEDLAQLSSFNLRFEVSSFSNRKVLSEYFIPSILCRIKSLSKLALCFGAYLQFEEESFDFSQVKEDEVFPVQPLFKAISHLAGSLQEFNLECPVISLGCFDIRRSHFNLEHFKLKGVVIDPVDFDTIKYVMNKDRKKKNYIVMKDLYIDDEDTHLNVLSKLKWIPAYFTGTVSLRGRDECRLDMLESLEKFLKNFRNSKQVSLEYNFHELKNHHLKYIAYAIKTSKAFEKLLIKAEDKIFTYTRDDDTTDILNLAAGQHLMDTPEISEEGDDEDEALSFFMQNGNGDNDSESENFEEEMDQSDQEEPNIEDEDYENDNEENDAEDTEE